MITSRLNSSAQTMIPAPILTVLRLKEGDEFAYSVESDRVILTKANHTPAGNSFATSSEWSSEEDWEAYADL